MMVFCLEKNDEIAEIKEKTSALIIKEFTKDGVMMQNNSVGEAKGKYHANHIETADVTLKMDGTMAWEVRAMETTKEGDVVMITGAGTGKQEKAMEASFKGELIYVTNSARLNWLNNQKDYVEGMTDQKNGESSMKIYAEKPQATIATPMM
jgi:hypothetical protein